MNRHILYLLSFVVIIGCNPFDSDRVMNYEPELTEITEFMKEYGDVVLDPDEDDRFAADMRSMGINYIVKNVTKNKNFSGFIEESDSLIIFIKKGQNFFQSERRIIYDFANNPRNFGNDKISNASYEIVQLNTRWYFSTTGFD
ncbi:MAG: hypothetical protein ACFHWX_05820 [Bacteroidota bacterium]